MLKVIVPCIVALLGIAFTHADTPAKAPFINHTKNRSTFCTSVAELAADVNKDSRIKLVLVGKFPDEQVCGELKFPYDADDVAHFLVHNDFAPCKRPGRDVNTIEVLAPGATFDSPWTVPQ